MYQFSYAEVVEDSPQDSRMREREALERAVDLLQQAKRKGVRSPEAHDGLSYVRKLWLILIEDLVNPENDLPPELKSELITIGRWVTRETDLIGTGASQNFDGLIEICSIVRNGLN